MSVDIERLRVDPDYWDEVSPMTGAKYYCPRHRYFLVSHCGCFGSIPRPTKTEWVDGLPPVGCECEVLHLGRTWEKCEIVAHVRSVQGPKAVWQLVGYDEWSGDLADKFRPIKTLKQRQREELAEIIAERVTVQCGTMMDDWQYDLIADAILSKYNLTEK